MVEGRQGLQAGVERERREPAVEIRCTPSLAHARRADCAPASCQSTKRHWQAGHYGGEASQHRPPHPVPAPTSPAPLGPASSL